LEVNCVAGYDGYPNFFGSLMNCIKTTISDHRLQLAKVDSVEVEDSGFDTGYSSDEKKKNLLIGRVHKKTGSSSWHGTGKAGDSSSS
jgi:hypothetical protein